METDNSALSGIRILDFSRVLAGPLCTMLLGDLGADVIKVERPGTGDETRAWGPPWAGDDSQFSAYFLSVNRNKRSMSLDLRTDQGQHIARELAKHAHIVIENFRPGQMERFNLDYSDLQAINPGLVYCSISGFGQDGPYRDRPGYDFVIQAMTGLMSVTGPRDDVPHKTGVAISDVFTALFACNAIQAALRHAEKTGKGQYIDMALYDSQLAALVNVGSNFLVSGQVPARYGNEHANIVPYQTFSASDTDFALAVGNDGQFTKLCDIIGKPHLSADPRYATNPARVQNRHSLVSTLQEIFIHKTAHEWVSILLDAGIPSGPINTVAQALGSENTISRQMVQDIQLGDGSTVRQVASPMHLSNTPPTTRLAPPKLGEHTTDILTEFLGMSADQIQQLRDDNVI